MTVKISTKVLIAIIFCLIIGSGFVFVQDYDSNTERIISFRRAGIYSPSWYHGTSWSALGAAGLASGLALSLGSSFTSAISSSSIAPGSHSGFGGRGGGGGGGGGGSSGDGGGGGGGW